MPAIQPVRLKAQAARLAAQFNQPREFARGLSTLLEEYADFTHRHGQAGEPSPLLQSFNTPSQVLRQVWLEITPLISSHPATALELVDALWLHPILEHRILAADILGRLPVDYAQEVINRVQLWTQAGLDNRLIDALLERSLARLRSQASQAVAALVENWLSTPALKDKQLGLRVLYYMASDPAYNDLPVIYRLLSPCLRVAPPLLRPDIIAIISSLIARSAPEVAYLFHQNLTTSDHPDTPWLIRQVIAEFPPELQSRLREAARKK